MAATRKLSLSLNQERVDQEALALEVHLAELAHHFPLSPHRYQTVLATGALVVPLAIPISVQALLLSPLSTITETIPAGASGNGGPSNGNPGTSGSGNGEPMGTPYDTGNYPTSPYTITVTVPNGGANPSSSGGLSPEGPNGPGGQGGASIIPTSVLPVPPGPFSGPFGVPPSQSQTEVPFSPFGGITPSSQTQELLRTEAADPKAANLYRQ